MHSKQEAGVRIKVRFNECDPTGFAYNGNYFIWMQEAAVECLRHGGIDMRGMASSNHTFVAVHYSCDFKKPVGFDDVVEARARLADVGESSFQLKYEILMDGEVVAVGKSVHVHIDTTTKTKMNISDELKRQLKSVM